MTRIYNIKLPRYFSISIRTHKNVIGEVALKDAVSIPADSGTVAHVELAVRNGKSLPKTPAAHSHSNPLQTVIHCHHCASIPLHLCEVQLLRGSV